MNANLARLSVGRNQHQRLFTQHQDRSVAEKMRRDHRAGSAHELRALHERGDIAAGIGHGRNRQLAGSGEAAFKAGFDPFLRQIAANEDDAAFAVLALFPWTLVVAVENHVHALKYETFVIVLE
jgi:hypothetical protein